MGISGTEKALAVLAFIPGASTISSLFSISNYKRATQKSGDPAVAERVNDLGKQILADKAADANNSEAQNVYYWNKGMQICSILELLPGVNIIVAAIAAIVLLPKLSEARKVQTEALKQQQSAGYMFARNQDLTMVSRTFDEYKTDPQRAATFIRFKDDSGNNILHNYLKCGNVQTNDLIAFRELIGIYNFEALLKTNNNQNKTPLTVALEMGQMGLISVVFPIIGGKTSWDLVSDEAIRELINKLSTPLQFKELLDGCLPKDTLDFDKLNHIMDGLYRMVLNGKGIIISSSIGRLLDDYQSDPSIKVPMELIYLKKIIDSGETGRIYEQLTQECETANTANEISAIMNQYSEIKRKATNKMKLTKTILDEDRQKPLKNIVTKALTCQDVQERNVYYNLLADLLNPSASYDQKIDFISEASLPILFEVCDLATNPDIQMEDVKEIVKMLILKNPEFLAAKLDGVQLADYLLTKGESGVELNQIIGEIRTFLNVDLFTNRMKKSLKYFLEDKGRSLIQ